MAVSLFGMLMRGSRHDIYANVRKVSGVGGVLLAGRHDLDIRIPPEILDVTRDFATPAQVLEDWLAENFLRVGFTFLLETGTPLADDVTVVSSLALLLPDPAVDGEFGSVPSAFAASPLS